MFRPPFCFHIQNIHHFFIVDDETFKEMSRDLLMLHSIYFDHHFVFTLKTFITSSSWMTKRSNEMSRDLLMLHSIYFNHHFVDFTFKTFITPSSWMTKRDVTNFFFILLFYFTLKRIFTFRLIYKFINSMFTFYTNGKLINFWQM